MTFSSLNSVRIDFENCIKFQPHFSFCMQIFSPCACMCTQISTRRARLDRNLNP